MSAILHNRDQGRIRLEVGTPNSLNVLLCSFAISDLRGEQPGSPERQLRQFPGADSRSEFPELGRIPAAPQRGFSALRSVG
jgi:hypothetical protein